MRSTKILIPLAIAALVGASLPRKEVAQNYNHQPVSMAGYVPTRDYRIEEARFYREGLDTALTKAYNSVSNVPSYITKNFIKEVARQESSFRACPPTSSAGAKGVMQMRKIAWAEVDTSNFNANACIPVKSFKNSIEYFAKIDSYLRNRNPNWYILSDASKRKIALAAYNAGPRRTAEHGFDVSDMSEGVQHYVHDISSRLEDP